MICISKMFRFYHDLRRATCNVGLEGLLVMLVSAAISAILFTILVWCNSHTWIYFKHKGRYIKVMRHTLPKVQFT